MGMGALMAAAVLAGGAPWGQAAWTGPVAPTTAPPEATRGQCRPDPAGDAAPEALARRFHEIPTEVHVGVHNQRGAMAALLTPDAILFNGHDNVSMSGEAFISFIGTGRAGRPEVIETLISGGTVVTRARTANGGEVLTVIRTNGGCIAAVATFWD